MKYISIIVVVVFASCSVSKYTQTAYRDAQKEKPFDVIIVPGVPYDGDKTTDVMKMRLYWAKHLYDSGFTKHIIFSGSAVYTPYVEGIVMKLMADDLGIPPGHTFSETKAEHSTENVYYGWKMAKAMGFEKIAVASDPYQSRLLQSFQRKYCPGTKSIPIVFGKMNIETKTLPTVDVTSAHVKNFKSIKAREGFFTRLQYTLGRRVKQEVKESKKLKAESKKLKA